MTMYRAGTQQVWSRLQLDYEEIRALKSTLAASHVGSRIVPGAITGVIPPSAGGTGYSLNGSPLGVTVWLSPGATTQYSVVVGATTGRTYALSTTQAIETVIGVADDAAAGAGENIRVRNIGYQSSVRVTGAVTAGHYLRQSTTSGVAESAGAVQTSGSFARALTAAAGPGAGNVDAYLFPPVPASVYYSGHIRVGSLSAPSNTTAGDLTSTRAFAGDDAAVANNARVRLNVASHVPAASTTHYHEIAVIVAPNGSSASERDPFDIEYQVRPTANDAGLHIAYRVALAHDSGAFNLTHASNGLVGTTVVVDQNVAASTVTYQVGVRANLRVILGTSTTVSNFETAMTGGGTAVTTWTHFNVGSPASFPAALTTHRGLNVPNLGNAAVTTAVAVEIAAQTSAGTNIGIRNASNSRQTGYGSFIGVGAPTNVTDGDVTVTRLRLNGGSADGAFATTDTKLHVRGTMNTTSGLMYHSYFQPAVNPASNSTAQYYVIVAEPTIAPSAGVTLNLVAGMSFALTHTQDSTLATALGQYIAPVNLTTTVTVGTITDGIGLQIRPYARFAGTGTVTVTNLYGIDLVGPTHAGATVTTYRSINIQAPSASTITTHIGIEIASLTQASTNIGIRNASSMRQIGVAMFGVDAAATALVHVQQQTLGNEVFRIESIATNDDPSTRYYQNRAATTDATVTTLHTYTVPASTTVQIVAEVVARRTGGASGTAEDGASYVMVATVKNVAGTATLIGAVSYLHIAEDQVAWDATIDVTGATARVRVTGAASNNITWHLASFSVQPVSS